MKATKYQNKGKTKESQFIATIHVVPSHMIRGEIGYHEKSMSVDETVFHILKMVYEETESTLGHVP